MELADEEQKVVFTPLYAITASATGDASAPLVDPVLQAQEAQRRRAERFGLEYQEPPKDMFLQVKRYANPFLIEEAKQKKREARGIRFGLIDPEEKAKRERRLAKFGSTAPPSAEAEEKGKGLEAEGEEEDEEGGMELEVREERKQWPSGVKRRPDTLYFYGTDKMSTEDVFAYFGEHKPLFVEWIDDSSCNVVFSDFNTAAQALMAVTTSQVEDAPMEVPPGEPELLYVWRRGRQWGKYPMLTRFATIEDRRPLVPKKSAYFEEMMQKRAQQRRDGSSVKVTITKSKQQQATKNKKSRRERRRKNKKHEELMELNDNMASDESGSRKKKSAIAAIDLSDIPDEVRRQRELRFGGRSIPPLQPDPVAPVAVPLFVQPPQALLQPQQPQHEEHLL